MRLSRAEAKKAGLDAGPKRAKIKHNPLLASLERDIFDDHCADHGLPRPQREFRFHPTRRWRFDYLFGDWLAVEKEGGVFAGGRHSRGAGYRKDLEKYNAAALLGYTVLRFLPEQFKSGAAFWTIKAVWDRKKGR